MIRNIIAALLTAVLTANLCGCTGQAPAVSDTPYIMEGYSEPRKAENFCAECFTIYEYDNGDAMITTNDGKAYLIADSRPAGLAENITVIPHSPDHIYMAGSAVMCFYDAMDRLSDIRFSAIAENDWYIENARAAMQRGDIIYAGKYREPDYELLLTQGCRLSVQSTMSEHVPKVSEKLNELGIPVFVDRSSYEPHPLGRCEWVRVYARIAGCPELGEKLFNEQKRHFDELKEVEETGKSAVFFYITSSGRIVTRKAGDYITKMIEMAGGRNVFDFIGDDNAMSAVTLEPEKFCMHAKDADILIYNCNISGDIHSIDELTEKNGLLKEFRAVKNGNVWCTGRSVYQDIMKTGDILTDMHTVFADTGEETTYLYKIS